VQLHTDHLVFGCRDLEAGCDEIEKLLGVRPAFGGKHTGRGTHNALLSLGLGVYLEVIAPDPEQQEPAEPRAFGLDSLRGPRLVTWAARVESIDAASTAARAMGYDPGPVTSGSRALPGGGELKWKLAVKRVLPGDGIVPFLIEWGLAQHPSLIALGGCALVDLEAEYPHPDTVQPMLDALGVDLQVSEGGRTTLLATIECPRGTVVLS
jgi:hypothetical protein